MDNGFLTGRTVTRNMCEGKNNRPVSLYKYPIMKHVYISYHMSLAVLLSDCNALPTKHSAFFKGDEIQK